MNSTPGREAPVIYVLAGVNGAGKSSIGGAFLRHRELDYYNPDEFAREVKRLTGCSMQEANGEAWRYGLGKLETAIRDGANYGFETTLGGRTIPTLLARAAQSGHAILMWYCGLSSLDLHIRRVASRVAAGGHDIPEALIRKRWDQAPENLIGLLPCLTELRVFDNSAERNPATGEIPAPRPVLHLKGGKVLYPRGAELRNTPEWAKAVVEAAFLVSGP